MENAITSKTMAERERVSLMAEWTRLGVLFNTAPAPYRVDLEELIVRTAGFARMDERLFVMAASWLADHHRLLDARRLGRKLDNQSNESSAVAGAMLSLALQEASSATQLRAAVKHCEPIDEKQPLYFILFMYPALLDLVKQEALALFDDWGFWHNDVTLKRSAIRPVAWINRQCPELRLRALVGTGLDSEILDLLREESHTIAELTRLTGATYAATHTAAMRLLGRGLLRRDVDSRKPLRLNMNSMPWIID